MERRRRRLRCRSDSFVTSLPVNNSVPDVGVSTQPSMCSSVDLPHPEGPRIAMWSPGAMRSVTSATAVTGPAGIGNTRLMCVASTMWPLAPFTLPPSLFSVRVQFHRSVPRSSNAEHEHRAVNRTPNMNTNTEERTRKREPPTSSNHLDPESCRDQNAGDDANRIQRRNHRRCRQQQHVDLQRARLVDEKVDFGRDPRNALQDLIETQREHAAERQRQQAAAADDQHRLTEHIGDDAPAGKAEGPQ